MRRSILSPLALLVVSAIVLTLSPNSFAAQSAFSPISAIKYSSMQGVQIVNGSYVGYIDQGDYIVYKDVDFGNGANSFSATIAVPASNAGQRIELRVDRLNGPLLGVFVPRRTGGWEKFKTERIRIRKVSGTRPLYLIAAKTRKDGYGYMNIQSFVFGKANQQIPPPMQMPPPTPMPIPSTTTSTTMAPVTTTMVPVTTTMAPVTTTTMVPSTTTTTMPSIPSPVNDLVRGQMLYTSNCSACHGPLTTSAKSGATPMRITSALSSVIAMSPLSKKLTSSDINAISMALGGLAVPNTPPPATGGSTPDQTQNPGSCNSNVAGFVNIRRLTNYEFDNVIRDLMGVDLKPSSKYKFPADSYGVFYSNTAAPQGVDMTLAQSYVDATSDMIDTVFSQARGNIVTCSGSSDSTYRSCADKVIRDFGLKAFRRPLTMAEISQFLGIYDQTKVIVPSGQSAAQAFDESLKASLQAILLSPQFLYQIVDRSNVAASTVKALDGYELASRLSFFIWGSIPDATLFNLAANGTITNKDVLKQQVDRMLKDPKSTYLVDVFAAQWLKLEKFANRQIKPDPMVFPEFSESLRDAMMTETRMLLSDVIQKDGSPYLLINADYTYLNKALATHYGISGPMSNQFTKVSLANTSRIGIVTHGSVLTANSKSNESSIVIRGVWALDRLLCAPTGPPPPNVKKEFSPATANLNPQKRLEAHIADPACASCHSRIDPIGVSLEVFDGDGKLRNKYPNGDAINTQGQFPPPSNASFNNAKEMSDALSSTGSYGICISRHMMNFSLGRDLTEGDVCAADSIGKMVVTPQSKFSDLVKAVVTSEQFMKQAGGN